MDTEILQNILKLDSLIGFLSWYDRAMIHKGDSIVSKRIFEAYAWICREGWEPPEMKYGQDRLLYFFHPEYDCWFVDEDYLKLYPKYKEELTKLKYLSNE